MSGLRDLKRSGGYLLPDARGAWCHFHGGEMAKCPYPDCRAAWIKVADGRVISTRLPNPQWDPALIGSIRCRSCHREFDVAAPESNPKALRLE